MHRNLTETTPGSTATRGRGTRGQLTYDIDPRAAALVTVDVQVGFSAQAEHEPVPDAAAAVANVIRAADAWRAAGGLVIHVYTCFTPDRGPAGRMTDFVPDAATGLADGAPAAALYYGVAREGDVLVRKHGFSAVLCSDLVARLGERGVDTAVVVGLTTPICVQTTVDGLSMSGIKTIVLEDACASQPIGSLSAAEAHTAALERMAYLFAQVVDTTTFVNEIQNIPVQPA